MGSNTFGKLAAGVIGLGVLAGIGCAVSRSPSRRLFGASAEALSGSEHESSSRFSSPAKSLSSFSDAESGGTGSASSGPSLAASAGPAMGKKPPAPSGRREPAPQARQEEHGQLTAGDWDDNLNFPFFLSYEDSLPRRRARLSALDGVGPRRHHRAQ